MHFCGINNGVASRSLVVFCIRTIANAEKHEVMEFTMYENRDVLQILK